MKTTVTNCKKNIMGTVSFYGQFNGMRKAADFIVYPMQDSGEIIKIQSNTRIGTINLFDGLVTMSQAHSGGAYFLHLQLDKPVFSMLAKEDCQTLRQWVKSTGGLAVGESIVLSDNTGAIAL